MHVEQGRALQGVASGDRHGAADATSVGDPDAAARAVEARTTRLLDDPGELRIAGWTEQTRFSKGADHAIFAEPAGPDGAGIGPAAGIARRVPVPREQAHRPIRSLEIC